MYRTELMISEHAELGMKLAAAIKHVLWHEGYKVKGNVTVKEIVGNKNFEIAFKTKSGELETITLTLDRKLK